MKRIKLTRTLVVTALALCLTPACKAEPAAAQPSPSLTAPASSPASVPATGNVDCAPFSELAQLDTRKPVPLQPMMAWHQKQNMMDHLHAIEGITAALATKDWAAVAKAAARIESSPQMQQMCQHMGAGAAGFTEMALEFHRRADAIGKAAQVKDTTGVLKATAHTLQACTQCHSTYRQEVVDAKTWQQRTGMAHNPTGAHSR